MIYGDLELTRHWFFYFIHESIFFYFSNDFAVGVSRLDGIPDRLDACGYFWLFIESKDREFEFFVSIFQFIYD